MGIREWEINDLEKIMGLFLELNEALDEDQYIDKTNILVHFYEMKNHPEVYKNYVYEIDNKIVGFLSLIFYRSIYHKIGTAQINELIVSKPY